MDTTMIYSVGWTLIHSFWQLTLLAAVFYILMLMCRNERPSFRYLISLVFMLISVSITSVTFIIMYYIYSMPPTISEPLHQGIIYPDVVEKVVTSTGIWPSVIAYLESNVISLTYMYMTGLGLLFIRMVVSYRNLNRFKRRSTSISDQDLPFLDPLLRAMNFSRKVNIRSSVMSNMPMVIGAIQPVVLIPASMLSNTAPHILKAIIAHELAHIKRHDFIINIFQTVIETLFFYHPAVWYFSYIARREREFCCDQLAINGGCPPEDLARALTEVGSLQRQNEWAMSLGGPSHDLLNRVKYLLGYKPSLHYVPTNSIWYYGSLLGVFFLFSIGKSQFTPSSNRVDPADALEKVDTLPEPWMQIVNISTNKDGDTLVWMDTIRSVNYSSGKIDGTDDSETEMIKRDTIPRKKKLIIKTDNARMTIINGDTTIIYNTTPANDPIKFQKWLDSLDNFYKELMGHLPDHQADSILMRNRQNMKSRRIQLEIQRGHLDSLNRELQNAQSRVRAYQFSLPDSFPGMTFAMPPMPPMPPKAPMAPMPPKSPMPPMPPIPPMPPTYPMDTIIPYSDILKNLQNNFGVDSLIFHPNGDVGMPHFSDSLMYSFRFKQPRVNGFGGSALESEEMKDLDKKIRAKERELRELHKEKWERYLEELIKRRQEEFQQKDNEK